MKSIVVASVLTLTLMGAGLSVRGQEEEGKRTVRKLMLPGETHQFCTLTKKNQLRVPKGLTYKWYKNNSLHETQGGYDGYLVDGQYTVYYANSDLKEKGTYQQGLKNGEWRSWYNNGKLREIYTWKGGLLNGAYYAFDSMGSMSYSGNYKNDLKHGRFCYYYNGVITMRQLYKNGKLITPKEKKVKTVKKDSTSQEIKPVTDTIQVKKTKDWWPIWKKKAETENVKEKGEETPKSKGIFRRKKAVTKN